MPIKCFSRAATEMNSRNKRTKLPKFTRNDELSSFEKEVGLWAAYILRFEGSNEVSVL